MDIFQKSITPDKPRVLAEEQIYVYVPMATSTNAGIASYNRDQFDIIGSEVSLKWPAESFTQGPIETPSIIKVLDNEFEYTGNLVDLISGNSKISSDKLEVQLKRILRDAYERPELVMLDPNYFVRTITEKDGKQYYKYNTTAIHYNMSQNLSEDEQAQARQNISASSISDNDATNKRIDALLQTGVYSINGKTGNVVLKNSDLENDTNYATEQYVQENGGKIDKILLNNEEQAIVDKAVNLTINKTTVGLSNVDNTSDLNKPISTQTQTALDGLNQTITNNFNNLNSSIENEIERATLAETEISTKLQQEMNTRVQEHAEIQGKIDTINSKIPNQASSTNQLADKDFVNSTINSRAAFFKGSFKSKAALDAVQWQTTDSSLTTYVSNNDYAYVEADETHNNEAWRYIYVKNNTVSEWQPQFRVNESPFTQAQLDAINSGATTDLINSINNKLTVDDIVDETGDSSTKAISQRAATLGINAIQSNLNTHILDKNNPHQVTKTQIGLGNVDNTSDLDKPISTAVQNALKDYLPLAGGNLTSNISVNNKAKMTTEGYVVGTWLQATNTADIGNSNWSDVWVNHNGWLYKRNKSDFINDLGFNNYVPITRTINDKALSSNISLSNKDVGALPDYTLTISHQTAGNPRMVKFVSVNYASKATCFKMGAMTCHDNGSSYQFLTDMLIAVTTSGVVTANIYKFAQSSIGNVDGVARYTGDVFYVNDTTNKIVDFYILCGQYSSSQFTPVTKVGSTTIAYVTQYSGNANYYSSGDKVWVNGCGTTYARLSDIPTVVTPVITATATTLPAGSSATVTKSGTAENPNFEFGIPKGDKGDKGEKGEKGDSGTVVSVNGEEKTSINTDTTPTANSQNLVTSGGVHDYPAVTFAESERQKSKNLFNALNVKMQTGLSYNENTNTFTYTINEPVSSGNTTFAVIQLGYLDAGTYTVSFQSTSSVVDNENGYTEYIIGKLNQQGNYESSIVTSDQLAGYNTITFTISERLYVGMLWYYKRGWIDGDTPAGNKTLKNIQVEYGSVATDYQPYNGAIVHEKGLIEKLMTLIDKIYVPDETYSQLRFDNLPGIYNYKLIVIGSVTTASDGSIKINGTDLKSITLRTISYDATVDNIFGETALIRVDHRFRIDAEISVTDTYSGTPLIMEINNISSTPDNKIYGRKTSSTMLGAGGVGVKSITVDIGTSKFYRGTQAYLYKLGDTK